MRRAAAATAVALFGVTGCVSRPAPPAVRYSTSYTYTDGVRTRDRLAGYGWRLVSARAATGPEVRADQATRERLDFTRDGHVVITEGDDRERIGYAVHKGKLTLRYPSAREYGSSTVNPGAEGAVLRVMANLGRTNPMAYTVLHRTLIIRTTFLWATYRRTG